MRLVGSVLQRGTVSISPQERGFFPLLCGAGFQKEEHLQSRCNSWSVFCCSGHSPDFSFHPILFHLIQTNFSPQSGQQETQEWNKVACLIKGRSLSVTWQWIQTSDQNKNCNKKKTNSRDSPNSWLEFCVWTKIKAEPVLQKSWQMSEIQDFLVFLVQKHILGW